MVVQEIVDKTEVEKGLRDLTLEDFEKIEPLSGKVFLEFLRMKDEISDEGEDSGMEAIFGILFRESLRQLGFAIEDPFGDLTLPQTVDLLSVIMEKNNLDELFRAFERFNRNSPTTE